MTLLAGCNTDDELAQQKLDMLTAEADSLQALKNDLNSHMPGGAAVLEGPGTVSIFVSKNLLDSGLKGMAGVVMPIPDVPNATLTIKSVTAELKLGFPLVTVDAEATKKDIGLTLRVVGTARLETKIDPAVPPQLTVSLRLEELVPRAQWGIFDFEVRGFVKDLINAKASKKLGEVAKFQVPIATDIPLALPARQMPVSFPGVNAVVTTPAMAVTGQVVVSRVLVLPDGIHVYGSLTARVGS
ncbi:hypothetical protein A9R05_15630 [Burkholderia sp. KK1]|nr:hypothetical protein A9R05_15630 [Burkholderia sp. KK1]